MSAVVLFLLAMVQSVRSFPSWYACDATNCKAPDCRCASLMPPNGLTPEETPQIITITHDDAVNPLSNKVVKAVIDKHTNPNGCNAPATWFTLQTGSDCATVKKLYDENSEIAVHTVNHLRLDPSFAGGEQAMADEMFGVRAWLNTSCGIPLEDLVGFRAPYLISNQKTRALLQKEGMLYDSSMISAFSQGSEVSSAPGQRPFPFTMDRGIPINAEWNYPDGQCNCSTESYPGMFELPMYELQNAAGEHLASMDPEGDVFNIYRENFDMNYNNNRAPFGVYLHAPWFNDRTTAALNQFMEYAMAKPDVWVLTMRQLAEWMKNPVPASKMGEWLTCKNVTLTPAVGTLRCQQYTVQEGDSAYSVATSFAVTLDDFLLSNPSIGTGENMKPGDLVAIPPWDDGCVGEAIRPVTGPGQVQSEDPSQDPSSTKDPCKIHIVIPEDTWDNVAAKFSVKPEDLRKANPDVPGDVLSSGVTLRIPPYEDSCPVYVNEVRPVILGPSQGVEDANPPPSGFRVNMILSGRPKIDFEFDLGSPFKSTMARAIGMTGENDVRFAKITPLNSVAGLRKARRALLQASGEAPEVNLEMTLPQATPLTKYANVSRDLSTSSQFATRDLQAFRLTMKADPVIRIIQNGVTMDVDPNTDGGYAATDPSQPAGTSQSVTPSSSTPESSGLSTGAIVGIAVGAAAACILLAVAAIMVIRRRRDRTNKNQDVDPSSSSVQSSPKVKSIEESDEDA
jgi:LysM repeat protein